MEEESANRIKIGIISNTNNEDTRRLYLNTLQVPCGFVPVKLEKAKAINALLEILKAVEAKGRRKHIRVNIKNEATTTINISVDNTFVTGEIKNISVVGLCCVFFQDIELEKNSVLHDMQIKLQGALLKAEGIVFGYHMEGPTRAYVLLFTQKLDPSVRAKIRAYILKNLQSKMDAELK